MQSYLEPLQADETRLRIERAKDSLLGIEPADTEDAVFQLLGLHWAGIESGEASFDGETTSAEKGSDGGWAPSFRDRWSSGRAEALLMPTSCMVGLAVAPAERAADTASPHGGIVLASSGLQQSTTIPDQGNHDRDLGYRLLAGIVDCGAAEADSQISARRSMAERITEQAIASRSVPSGLPAYSRSSFTSSGSGGRR